MNPTPNYLKTLVAKYTFESVVDTPQLGTTIMVQKWFDLSTTMYNQAQLRHKDRRWWMQEGKKIGEVTRKGTGVG